MKFFKPLLLLTTFLIPSASARDWDFEWVAGGNITELIHNGSEYLGITGSDSIASSADGENWTLTPGNSSIQAWVHHDGVYVQVDGRGVIYHSDDRENWTKIETGVSETLRDVTYGGGLFMCVGDKGVAFSSSDGLNWEGVEIDTEADVEVIHYGLGFFLAATDDHQVFSSPDGVTWTESVIDHSAAIADFTNNEDSLFMAVGRETFTSSDGVTWTVSGVSRDGANAIAYGEGILVRGGFNEYLSRSSDFGVTWESFEIEIDFFKCESLTYGPQGFLVSAGRGILLRSETGEVWEQVSSLKPHSSVFDLIFDGQQFVGIGNSSISTSPDGIEWTYQSRIPVSFSLNQIQFANGQYVSVGYPGKIAVSQDLVTWEDRSTGELDLNSAAYGNGTWVAVAVDGPGLKSTDNGVTWVPLNLPEDVVLISITYADGKFVAVGGSGLVVVSSDGVNWETGTLPGGGSYNNITYVDGEWFAWANRSFATSTDAVTWAALETGLLQIASFAANGEENEYLLAGLGDNFATNTELGEDWILRPKGHRERFLTATYGAGRFVVITGSSLVLATSSTDVNSPQVQLTRTGANTALLSWDISFGTDWEIWSSSTLENDWALISATIIEDGGEAKAALTLNSADQKRFFQLR